MPMNLNMLGKNGQIHSHSFILQFVFNRVSVPKFRVKDNVYQFRPQKRALLSDLSTDSVALANVMKHR